MTAGRLGILRALGALLAVALLAGCSSATPDGEFEFGGASGNTRVFYDPPQERGVLPPIAGDDLLTPGGRISSEDFRGQVVVLNVWGSWCGPCRGEAGVLAEVAAASAPRGVQFLGVNVRDDRDAAADFVRDRGKDYPSIYDPPGRSLLALRGYPRNTVPTTVVLDRQHRVAAIFLTAVLVSDLQPVVDRVAAEPPAPA